VCHMSCSSAWKYNQATAAIHRVRANTARKHGKPTLCAVQACRPWEPVSLRTGYGVVPPWV
jgi:hypothetical protein